MSAPAIVALTPGGLELARTIAHHVAGAEIHGLSGRCIGAAVEFTNTMAHLAGLFTAGRPIVGICATGILIRALAPHISDKRSEPPVVAVGEGGGAVVSLIGGHRGANDLAHAIAEAIGATAAITTASDAVLGLALDDPPAGYVLGEVCDLKDIARRLIAGEPARITGAAPWLEGARFARSPGAAIEIIVTDAAVAGGPDRLVYHPATLAVGIGAERGADPEEAAALVRRALEDAALTRQSVAVVASLDLKEDEHAIHSVSEMLACPARFFTAGRLDAETPRVAHPSAAVLRAVGSHSVAEAAALAAAGPNGTLVVEKRIGRRVTCALARAPRPIDPMAVGRARARLAIVGLGPGGIEWRSHEAQALVASATDLVGYARYLDLAGRPRPGQRRHDFALGEEEARVSHALDLAAEGRDVVLVSSGDPGIYAMAALAFEMVEHGPPAWRRVAITVAPGISALQAAAARAGAPLGHDFCAISLSDLLTPADVIERRLEAAASGDFVVALYNPASRTRRVLLDLALAILARHRPASTPVVVARDLGRAGEWVEVTTLADVDPGAVDMLTLVLVGSSATRSFARGDGSVSVYTPRGYAPAAGARAKTAAS